MNLLTYRLPTLVAVTDTCEAGLGILLSNGMAARWKIQNKLQQRVHINLLEFLGQLAAIWILSIKDCFAPHSCLLVNGDSSTAQGWIRKSNCSPKEVSDPEINVKLQAARKVASILTEREACIYSQWFPGDENDITDSLSRDLHLSDNNLTRLLTFALPYQLPHNFSTVPFPKRILSAFSSWLLMLLAKRQPLKQHKTSALLVGNAGCFSSKALGSAKKPSSTTSNNTKKLGYSGPSVMQSEQHCIVRTLTKSWLQTQSEVPWTTCHRPSATTMNPIPSSTGPVTLQTFYFASSKETPTLMEMKSNKKQSLPSSSENSLRISQPTITSLLVN